MQKYLPKHLAKKSIVLPEFSPKKRKKDWRGKPASWPDIRKNAQDGHIYLLVDTRYPIGFIATATDGYSVKIDGVAYDDYTSNEQFSMSDWTDYTATEGYAIDYPTGATKAHIIDIYPQTEDENITAFKCARVAASGTEYQGVLWAHFNIDNAINLNKAFGSLSPVEQLNQIMMACTAKNNTLFVITNIQQAFRLCQSLEYTPIIDGNNNTIGCNYAFASCHKLTNITIKNIKATNITSFFSECRAAKKVNIINCDFTGATSANSFITEAAQLINLSLDFSANTGMTLLRVFGTSEYFMSGLKGLRVSSSAPFTGATPQINVSYTGLDRAALVQLFNDLPTVSAGQIINILGTTGAGDLTAEDEAIATNKGWTITK